MGTTDAITSVDADLSARPEIEMQAMQANASAFTRRRFVAFGAATVTGAAATAAGLTLRTDMPAVPPGEGGASGSPQSVGFEGIHQSGVASTAQGHLLLVAYDLAADARRDDVATVMKSWTSIARQLTTGRASDDKLQIARGAGHNSLTVTVGIGGTMLDRFNIPRPEALVDLPTFEGDQLVASRSNGDLIVQLCADDPIVLAEADRALQRAARPAFDLRWRDSGFRSTTAREGGHTTRNLMGQLDGTNNVSTGSATVGGPVWVDAATPEWLVGGTYMVFRRIRMLLDEWERLPLRQQERAIGRHKASGAPIGSQQETDAVDLDAVDAVGAPLIPTNSHVRLSKPRQGEEMLRRGYSYSAAELDDGSVDQGLLFVSFQSDPRTSFVPVQRRLAAHDKLNPFTRTVGSGLFAVLPGVTDASDWFGRALLA